MSSLHTQVDVRILNTQDRVVLRFNKTDVFIPYSIAASIAQHIRLNSKRLKAIDKESALWNNIGDVSGLEVDEYKQAPSTQHLLDKFRWEIAIRGDNIILKFGELVVESHYSSMLQISQWMRKAVAKIKHELGDTSRSKYAAGILTDAEENYRLGIN